jgi:hypothetical protein
VPVAPPPVAPVTLPPPAPLRPRQGDLQLGQFGKFLYTHNPFYAISAALVFWGLRSSFDTQGSTFHTFALMGGLVAYTMLLALAAYLVIRFGKVWQDGRILLVLIVLVFLATSISFDDALTIHRANGTICYVAGLAFSLMLSEVLLRAIGLYLPILFRLPYYLLLAVFFLYPVAMRWMLDPFSPAIPWALLTFPAVAGLAYLTLLPAIRRGPAYVKENGSPWIWPFYPWTLFFMIGLGVCGRAYYLCVSMHLAGGSATIFAPYFLVPFLLAVCVLLLEIGIVSQSAGTLAVAMLGPAALVLLALVPPTSRLGMHFLHDTLMGTVGVSPPLIAAIAVAGFYAWAMLRRVPLAAEAMSAALLLVAVLSPATIEFAKVADLRAIPVLLVGILQGGMAAGRRSAGRWLVAAGCVIASAMLEFQDTAFMAYQGVVPAHLMLAAVLVIAAVTHSPFAKFLQNLAALALLAAAVFALSGDTRPLGDVHYAWLIAYPAMAIVTAAAYGWLVRNRLYYGSAGGMIVCWLAVFGVQGYRYLSRFMAGLDYILWGLFSLGVAMLITLTKTGATRRWWRRWRKAGRASSNSSGE